MVDASSRQLGGLLLVFFLAGCCACSMYIPPVETTVTDISPEKDGYDVSLSVSMDDDWTISTVTVTGYGPRGTRACDATVAEVGNGSVGNASMHCSEFPQILTVDSPRRTEERDRYARYPVVAYVGYDEDRGHHWESIGEADDIGLPPTTMSYSNNVSVFEYTRCRQRVEGANVSILGDVPWVERPSRNPDKFRYQTVVLNASKVDDAKNVSIDFVPTKIKNHLEQHHADEISPGVAKSVRNRARFLVFVGWLEGQRYAEWSDLPRPNNTSYASVSDSWNGPCWNGYSSGRIELTYTYMVEYNGTKYAIEMRYVRVWEDPGENT